MDKRMITGWNSMVEKQQVLPTKHGYIIQTVKPVKIENGVVVNSHRQEK